MTAADRPVRLVQRDGRAAIFAGTRPAPGPTRAALNAAVARNPGAFRDRHDAERHFGSIRVPASFRWAFKSIDKAASSSALRFLFELEFGVPLTVEVTPPADINTDAIAHMAYDADVLRTPLEVRRGIARLEKALRLATTRDPAARAVSGFLYICRTQDQRAMWMVQDRLRLSALTGFDWQRHPRTLNGFLRFLDYVEAAHEAHLAGGRPVNTHWQAQWLLMQPAVFRPHLIGRTEAMGAFYAEVAARLDRPLPAGWSGPHTNAQRDEPATDLLESPAARERIGRIYARDFEEFGYDL